MCSKPVKQGEHTFQLRQCKRKLFPHFCVLQVLTPSDFLKFEFGSKQNRGSVIAKFCEKVKKVITKLKYGTTVQK